jgi:hypothetical protein
MIIEVPHLMWIPMPIVTTLVLEVEFYAIFHVINVLFDNMCNVHVLIIWRKLSSKGSLLLANESFNLGLLQIRQDSCKVVGNVDIKMFSLLPYHDDNLLDFLLCDPFPRARLIPLLRGLLARLCDCPLIGSEVESLLDYLLPVVVLLSIVFFEVIN